MNQPQQLSTPEVFEHYTTLISETRGKLFSGLWYEQGVGKLIYYKSYFSSADIIDENSMQKQVDEAQEIIGNLRKIEEEIAALPQLNTEQKEVLIGTLHKEITGLEYHCHAIYLEAEKAGVKQEADQISFHNQKKLQLEKKLYGASILEIPYRAQNAAGRLRDLYARGSERLSEEEQAFRTSTIAPLLEPYSPAVSNAEKKEKAPDTFITEEALFPLVNALLEIEGLEKEKILNIQMDSTIDAPEVKEGIYFIPNAWGTPAIEKYFEERWMKNHFKVIKLMTGSAGVSIVKGAWPDDFKHNSLKLPPASEGKYNLTQRVLPVLFDHEIATHVKTGLGNVRNYNMSTNGGSDFEEGVALFNQHMASNDTLEGFYEASIGDIGQFLGEQLDDQELLQALEILMQKLDTTITLTPKERARRIRIWIPLGEKWARRADMSYGTGRDIIKQMEEMSSSAEGREQLKQYAKAKYGTKLAFPDVERIDQILEGIGSLHDMKVEYPNFVGKILYWKLFKGKLNKEEMLKTDLRALIAQPNTLTYGQKRLLVQMLDIIRKDLKQPEGEE